MHQPQIFSFCSGAGFLDLGFEAAGFDVVMASDNSVEAMDAYRWIRRDQPQRPRYGLFKGSVGDLLQWHGSSHVALSAMVKDARTHGLVGFVGGPPCPDFSVGGKNKGAAGDNGVLSSIYVELICAHKPDFFVFENVKGLVRTAKHRQFYEQLKLQLQVAGYILDEKLVQALDYGVPQDRERIILVGFRSPLVGDHTVTLDWAPQQNLKGTAAWPTTAAFAPDQWMAPLDDAAQRKLSVQWWFSENQTDTHPNAKHHFKPQAALPKFQTIDEGDVSKKSYKRLHRWRYSPTACYGNNEVHLHPYRARRLSAAECLAIQSMPAWVDLSPAMSLTAMFKTIGNGVPYLLAKGIAEMVYKQSAELH